MRADERQIRQMAFLGTSSGHSLPPDGMHQMECTADAPMVLGANRLGAGGQPATQP